MSKIYCTVIVIIKTFLFTKFASVRGQRRSLAELWVKLPRAHLSATHDGRFTVSLQ